MELCRDCTEAGEAAQSCVSPKIAAQGSMNTLACYRGEEASHRLTRNAVVFFSRHHAIFSEFQPNILCWSPDLLEQIRSAQLPHNRKQWSALTWHSSNFDVPLLNRLYHSLSVLCPYFRPQRPSVSFQLSPYNSCQDCSKTWCKFVNLFCLSFLTVNKCDERKKHVGYKHTLRATQRFRPVTMAFREFARDYWLRSYPAEANRALWREDITAGRILFGHTLYIYINTFRCQNFRKFKNDSFLLGTPCKSFRLRLNSSGSKLFQAVP